MDHLFNLILSIALVAAVLGRPAAAAAPAPAPAPATSLVTTTSFTVSNQSDLVRVPNLSGPDPDPDPGPLSDLHPLVLNSSASAAPSDAAFYSSPVAIYDAGTREFVSFLTTFTFSTSADRSYSTNGTIEFVIVPNVSSAVIGGGAGAGAGVSIRFQTGCGGGSALLPGIAIAEEAGNETVDPEWTLRGPNMRAGSIPCGWAEEEEAAAASGGEYVYRVFVEYNASKQQIIAGSVSAGGGIRLVTFEPYSLPGSGDGWAGADDGDGPYVGLVAAAGGVYSVSHWNFTTHDTGAYSSSGRPASVPTGTGTQRGFRPPPAADSGGVNGGAPTRIALIVSMALLGCLIVAGVAAAAAAFFVCRRRRRRQKDVSRGDLMMATDGSTAVQKPGHPDAVPPPATAAVDELDTAPLARNPSYAAASVAAWQPPPISPR